MCKIAICDDDKEYREKIKTVIETEGILSSNEIRFYEYESGKELLEDADILHDLIFLHFNSCTKLFIADTNSSFTFCLSSAPSYML